MKRLTIIDADSLAYLAGGCKTLQEAINKTDERIQYIINVTKADYISLFISKGKYFRHQIDPSYKGNRKGSPPMWMKTIKSYLEEKYEANSMPNVEADDLVMYWMNKKWRLHKDEDDRMLRGDLFLYNEILGGVRVEQCPNCGRILIPWKETPENTAEIAAK